MKIEWAYKDIKELTKPYRNGCSFRLIFTYSQGEDHAFITFGCYLLVALMSGKKRIMHDWIESSQHSIERVKVREITQFLSKEEMNELRDPERRCYSCGYPKFTIIRNQIKDIQVLEYLPKEEWDYLNKYAKEENAEIIDVWKERCSIKTNDIIAKEGDIDDILRRRSGKESSI